MTMNYESFEAAIADFYVSVAKLDPTVTPPIVGWKKTLKSSTKNRYNFLKPSYVPKKLSL